MVRTLKILFALIFILMVGITTWASLDKNVIQGFADIWAQPWGVATLADAYCGFLTFYAWVFYRETSLAARMGWFVTIMIFGNIAMSVYVLMVIFRAGPNARVEDILLKRTA